MDETQTVDGLMLDLVTEVLAEDTDAMPSDTVMEALAIWDAKLERMYTKQADMCGQVVMLTCGDNTPGHTHDKPTQKLTALSPPIGAPTDWVAQAPTPKSIGARTRSRTKATEEPVVVVKAGKEAPAKTNAEAFEGVATQMRYACQETGCGGFWYSREKALKHRSGKGHRVAERKANGE